MMRKNKSTILNHFGRVEHIKFNLHLRDEQIEPMKRAKTATKTFTNPVKMLELDIKKIDIEIIKENQQTARQSNFEIQMEKQMLTIQMLNLKLQDIEEEDKLNSKKMKKLHMMMKELAHEFNFYESTKY